MSPSRGSQVLWTLIAALFLLPFTFALQANLAGVVDWHKQLIGEPLLEPTPPRFVESSVGQRVVTITKSNVLAVLDAETGDVGELDGPSKTCHLKLTCSLETSAPA